jgi:WD40 repeat protein
VLVLDPKAGPVLAVAFHPTGRGLAAVARKAKGVLLWDDLAAGRPPRLLPTPGVEPDRRLRFSDDGRRVGFQDRDGHPVVLDLARGRPVGSDRFADLITTGEMTPAGDSVVFALGWQSWTRADATGFRLTCRPLEPSPRNPTRWAHDVDRWLVGEFAFLPGVAEFVGVEAVNDGGPPDRFRFVRRSLATGEEVAASAEFAGEVRRPAAGPGGRVAGVRTNQLVVWSSADGEAPLTWKDGTRRQFTDVAFHPSGAVLASANLDPTVRLHDPATGAVVRTYDWQVGKLRCVAFSPDGLLAAAGSESGRVVVWDVDG